MTARALPLNARTRPIVKRWIDEAPEGYMAARPSEPKKRRTQEEKYHAMLGDIAKQVPFFGQRRDLETVKRLLVDAFARVKAAEGDPIQGWGHVLPSLDGAGVVQLGIQTRQFTVSQAAEFIEYLYAWGADNDVVWSEPVQVPDWYREGARV